MDPSLPDGAREVLLALADDEHLMGQQHAEWIGVAPFLEEDLAFSSIAQDELGHAAALYEVLGDGDDADAIAFGRDPGDYRSCQLVELPCLDWADALARHWLYDTAEILRWEALAGSSWPTVAELVPRVRREEAYHRRHAGALVERMLDDPGEGGTRLRTALSELLPFADALWEPVGGEPEAITAGLMSTSSSELRERWRMEVVGLVGPVDLDFEAVARARPEQGARTVRSDHFAALHARITEVLRIDPAARW